MHSQDTAICPDSEPDQSNLYVPTSLIEGPF
jgi:hypothetical protein